MRKAFAVTSILAIALTLSATPSNSPSQFLRDYVSALCAMKNGDVAKAADLMEPYQTVKDIGMRAAANDFPLGQFKDASIQSSWSLVTSNWNTRSWQFAVSKRDRKEAVAELSRCFGAKIVEGPMKGQPQLEAGAATMAWFLTHDVEAIPVARDQWSPPQRPMHP